VSRASRRPRIQWTHDVCARTRQLVAAPPPAHVDAPPPMCLSPAAHTHTRSARPCRCPTTHVLLAARPRPSHTHSACHTAIPSHMCFSPRAPARLTYAVPTRPDPQLLLATRPRPSKTRVIAGLVHRHTQQRDGSIAHTGTSGTTPHGKNESIARAGIESKHEWHDTARQKREHRTRWYRKEARVARHRTAKTRASHALASKVSPTHATTRYGFGSTSARRNARGARHAGIGLAAFDREVCSGAKLGKVTWRGVSGMGSLYLDR
jgi:hypothetical protein